ncbi:25669_t:CDS:2 [Gigaspora rosea]|nr:25669_t:CDS:2 [Gigaspora rosea]
MLKVRSLNILKKSIDKDVNIGLSKSLQLDNTYILNSKQSSCSSLALKFKGYIFENDIIKCASKQAFTIDIDKVKSDTQLNNEIEKVEKCDSKLDSLFKRNFISCQNISNILSCSSNFFGDTFCHMLDHMTTIKCSYRKWEKEELSISKSNINPTKDFITAVENALKSKNKEVQLRMISREYGGFYARRLVFGGAIIKETSNDATIIRVRVIGGIKEYISGSSLKYWINSLDNRSTWDIIEYDKIYSIFDLLDDSLQQKVFDILGHRILKAGFNDIPSTLDFSKNAEHVHSLSPQLMGLDKIAKISNCYIFASFIDKSDRETFSLRICYKNEHVPLIIVHPKKPLHKKCKNSPIKVGWIIVGQPINFDFDQTKYPVVLKRINNQYKIESSKHEEPYSAGK